MDCQYDHSTINNIDHMVKKLILNIDVMYDQLEIMENNIIAWIEDCFNKLNKRLDTIEYKINHIKYNTDEEMI